MSTENTTTPTSAYMLQPGMRLDGMTVSAVSRPELPVDRSAGRECTICRGITDHHTDRHDEFADQVTVIFFDPSVLGEGSDLADFERASVERKFAYYQTLNVAVPTPDPMDEQWNIDEYPVAYVESLEGLVRDARTLVAQAPASPERDAWLARSAEVTA